jgi:hypothetical protein
VVALAIVPIAAANQGGLFTTTGFADGLAVVSANAAVSQATAPWLAPDNQVFTCDWIAQHPAAAAHWLVSCDPAGPPPSAVAVASAAPSGGVGILANSCQWSPGGNQYASTNVFAWTTYEYATNWDWFVHTNPANQPLAFHWYLQKTGGVGYLNGTESPPSSITVPGQPYRWGAMNEGYYPTAWDVCYH